MKAGAHEGEIAPPGRGPFSFVRTLLREPLVYFLLVGALVFAFDHARRREAETIRVTRSVRDDLARSLTATLGRAPQKRELLAALDSWKREQALYREGLKMGILDDDHAVRSLVASKLLQIARERGVFPAPTDSQLHDYFERHRQEYATPPTFDFDLVFFSRGSQQADARARADQGVSRLRAGASPEGLGDWFPRGDRFLGETASDVAQLLGEQAGDEMPGYAVGEWNLVQGKEGFYAIRVTAAHRNEPDFAKLRPVLAVGFDAERRERAAQAFAREVEARYRFVDSE